MVLFPQGSYEKIDLPGGEETLKIKVIDKFSNGEGMYCGRIGEIDEPIEFEKHVTKIEILL